MQNGNAAICWQCILATEKGFTYIGLLLMMAIAGIGLAATGISWHNKIRSEKEQELLFIGDQFRKAISSYYENAPSGTNSYPVALDDLLLDKRYPNIRRHLRKLYLDPITGTGQWGLLRQQGRIVGIYSLSNSQPIKMAGFNGDNQGFKGATSYRKWVFGQDVVLASMPSLSPAANKAIQR